ncbi:MAG: rRNA maturation RNase YbeY [Defluviitaleaceae bacterium]|nr:rRNA maturation RNase YbeY [Defluviitaleaceae bacterium]
MMDREDSPIILSVSDDITLEDTYFGLIEKVLLQGLADEGISTEEVSVLITTDAEIQRLNNRFRGINKPTDVLSFPQYKSRAQIPQNAENLGDIIISLPRAEAQAAEFGHSLRRELAFLEAHGLLHLLGYDHMETQGKALMRAREKEIMKEIGFDHDK